MCECQDSQLGRHQWEDSGHCEMPGEMDVPGMPIYKYFTFPHWLPYSRGLAKVCSCHLVKCQQVLSPFPHPSLRSSLNAVFGHLFQLLSRHSKRGVFSSLAPMERRSFPHSCMSANCPNMP